VPPFEFRHLAVVICARWSRGTMCLIECPADPSETRGTFHHLFWAGETLRPQQPLVPSPFSIAGLLHTFWAHAFTEELVACTREGRPSPEFEEKQWILAGAVTAATCWRDQEQRSVKELLTPNSGSSEADRPVRPVYPVVIRVGFVLFWKFLYKPTWRGVRLPRPINIKAKADWGIPNRINQKYRITFYLSNPSLFQP